MILQSRLQNTLFLYLYGQLAGYVVKIFFPHMAHTSIADHPSIFRRICAR